MINKFAATFRLAFLSAIMACSLAAGTFSFTGSFDAGDQIQFFNFITDGATTIYTLQYGGGTNAAGQAIPSGGFDSLLTIYDSSGELVGNFDDSAVSSGCISPVHPGNNGCYDSYFSRSLGAGSYVAALTQFNNTPGASLSNGFTYDPSCSPHEFCDKWEPGTARTGNWAVDFNTADAVAVAAPEPVTFMLAAFALVLILQRKRVASPGARS